MSKLDDVFHCIAVDMGAGSIRIMLGILNEQGISVMEAHRFDNRIIEQDGHERWEMEKIWKGILTGIDMAIDLAPSPPASIGVDSWGVDFVLLDPRGEPVDEPISYRDGRTAGMREKWSEEMDEMETFRRTGINFYTFNTLFQLLSLRDSELLHRTARILFMPCYINYLLSGRAVNELTISSTSQILGIGGMQWDPAVLERLRLDRGLLGDVTPPGTRLDRVQLPGSGQGRVNLSGRGLTGMENIAVCGHDTACVVAAIPVTDPDYVFISAGTWCILGMESDEPLLTPEAFQLGITNERGYGDRYRVLKNITGLWLHQGLKRHLPGDVTFGDMEQMTLQAAESLQVLDPDDPLFYNPPDMRKAFDDFFLRSGQDPPGDFSGYIRCAYDSLCFSFRYHVEQMEHLSGKSFSVLHVVGGGSQSDYLNQRIADVCGKKVVSGPVEGATLGNILIQAIAMGRIESLEEGRKLVGVSFPVKEYHPGSMGNSDEKRYQKFLTFK